MKAEVTEKEYQIARMLGDVWNLFLELPKEHPMQDQEFCTAIHRCQDMVLSRAGTRAVKEFETSDDRAKFFDYLKKVSAEVEKWPEWKRNSDPGYVNITHSEACEKGIPIPNYCDNVYSMEEYKAMPYHPEGSWYPSNGEVYWRRSIEDTDTHVVLFSK